MGTNFYRIPTEDEMSTRKEVLIKRINDMELSPKNIEKNFQTIPMPGTASVYETWDMMSPWGEFLEETKIHLGKRSFGWKFTWNFHKNKYYSNKEELLNFIRSGRVVDEYGDLVPNEEFIKEALEWGEPDGYIYNDDYVKANPSYWSGGIVDMSEHYSKIIDGLVVSAHDEFC